MGTIASTADLTRLTRELTERSRTVHSFETITNRYSQPWGHSKVDADGDDRPDLQKYTESPRRAAKSTLQ